MVVAVAVAVVLFWTVSHRHQGVAVDIANSRFADDEIVIDDNCTAAGEPEGLSCVGFRQKQQRAANVARCTDNNQTVRCVGFWSAEVYGIFGKMGKRRRQWPCQACIRV